jgi:hypothetical protein
MNSGRVVRPPHDLSFLSRADYAISTESGKEVPSMSKNEKKEPGTVDITALADEDLEDVVGGGGDVIMPLGTKPQD